MARNGPDSTDQLIFAWARVRRELLGHTLPRLARHQLGAPRCTLSERRDLHHGSRASKVDQRWPEFPYTGDGAIVNEIFKSLDEEKQLVMEAHYVYTVPRSRAVRAELMGLTVRTYWDRVRDIRSRVQGAMAIVQSVRTHSASRGAINATVE